MSKISLKLQSESLAEMVKRKPFKKKLGGFEYEVLPKVYKGGTDSELLCASLDVKKNEDFWDIGTGTGLVALYAKSEGARYVLATDFNPFAVRNAKINSALLKLKLDVKKADVFGTIKKKFDVITFNPPYTDDSAGQNYEISFWDKNNLAVKKFFSGLNEHLKIGGRAYISWSSFGNTFLLKKIAREYGFSLLEIARKKGKRDFVYYVYKIKPTLK